MRHETESVSLYALIQWGLQEHTERQLAALPSPQEVDAVLGDTSDFCRRVLEAVQQLLRRQRRGPRILRMVKRTVVAAAILAAAFFCLAMTNPSVRVTVIDMVKEWTGQSVGVYFKVTGNLLTELPEDYGPRYIPEGFVYQEESSWRYSDHFSYGYATEDGTGVLSIEVGVARNTSGYRLDNEHIMYEEISFSGVPAYLGTFKSNDGYVILWVKDGMEHLVYLSGDDVALSDLFEIAENIY